ncbi:MAG: hypothetical protein AB7G12_04100 [Thermoanaerobaculia bacterium]
MTVASGGFGPSAGREVARHALFWLGVSTTVGLGLATLLAFPRLGELLAPFGYGRFMAVHLELSLYGWTALPMLGLLLGFFEIDRRRGAVRGILTLWSATLAAGTVSWLLGRTSGKLFLDWTGGARLVFLGALVLLYGVLLVTAIRDWRASRRPAGLRIATLVVLASVPPILALATGRSVYPPIDPASGAPTGVSLLGSTLVLVLVLLAVPRLAALPRREGRRPLGGWLTGALILHGAGCLALFGPDRWSDEPIELLALASVLPWVVLVPLDFATFDWPPATARWARAAIVWGSILAVSGVVQFLPEPLAAARFTHLLVAHAHAAMAGFTSSSAFVLLELGRAGDRGAGEPIGGGRLFALWQGSTMLHVAALATAGALEVQDPAAVLRGSALLSAILAVRWLAGAGMGIAAWTGFAATREPL